MDGKGAVMDRRVGDGGQLYYVLNVSVAVGDSVLWWRPDGKGYTCNLAEAGLYDEDWKPSRPTDVKVPREIAEELSERHVGIGPLRERMAIPYKDGRMPGDPPRYDAEQQPIGVAHVALHRDGSITTVMPDGRSCRGKLVDAD